jgi:hypothetical protein
MAGYFSGIALIGGHLLVFNRWKPSVASAILTFVMYASAILGARRISLSSGIERSSVASVVLLVIAGPMFILVPYFYKGDIFFSSRYYFYLVNFLVLTPVSIFMYFQLWCPSKMQSAAAIKAELAFWNEILSGAMVVFAAALFGTIYAQSISGFLGPEEMFLVMFTLVGYVFFVAGPILFCIQERVAKIESLQEGRHETH